MLEAKGFQVEFHSHARAILAADFPQAVAELEQALSGTTIPIEEIIASGGEAKTTQRLRRALAALGWQKTQFLIEKRINGVARESLSHEIDHVRSFGEGANVLRVALEIEWNNKDPFYDRDLENFKRLHADGAISVGVIVTRGRSLHESMTALVERLLAERNINGFADLEPWVYVPTPKQRVAITQRVNRAKAPLSFREALAPNSSLTNSARPPRIGASWRTGCIAALATPARSCS